MNEAAPIAEKRTKKAPKDKRIAVIGAGACGLCAAKYLTMHADAFTLGVARSLERVFENDWELARPLPDLESIRATE